MAQTHPVKLSPDEVNRQARKYWGRDIGLALSIDQPNRLRFEGRRGFVELDIRPDTNNQVRLTIENQGYEQDIQKFRARLGKQGTAETKM